MSKQNSVKWTYNLLVYQKYNKMPLRDILQMCQKIHIKEIKEAYLKGAENMKDKNYVPWMEYYKKNYGDHGENL